MKKAFLLLASFVLCSGMAFAACDVASRAQEFTVRVQTMAVNDPQKFERIAPELEKRGEEIDRLMSETTTDPTRMDKVCAAFDALFDLPQ